MRIADDDLGLKALLAIEEAAIITRRIPVPPNYALRFCLAYLFTMSGGDRAPFDAFWLAVTDRSGAGASSPEYPMRRSQRADVALEAIYRAVGVERTVKLSGHTGVWSSAARFGYDPAKI